MNQRDILTAVHALRAGNPEAALAPLRAAVAEQPANALLIHDLGLALLETGRLMEAIEAFRQAIARAPTHTDCHFRLGLALERAGDAEGAVRAFDRATALQPSHAEAWLHAGAIVFSLGHREEAIGCFRRAATAGRGSTIGRLGQARALLAEQNDAEAERSLRQLLARDPDHAAANDLLGNLLADRGRFEEAADRFTRAIAADTLMAGSFYDLVRCRTLTDQDAPLLAAIRAALSVPDRPPEPRIRLHLALGKAEDDLGDPEAAMAQYDAADGIRRQMRPFDTQAFEDRIARLIALFPADRFTSPSGGRPDARPIFILGMPRSGTSLTEQILSSHACVAAGGELPFWNVFGTRVLSSPSADRGLSGLTDAADAYLALLDRIAPGAAKVTDKMPFNVLWAGAIHLALPNAILLHCRRRPIDTAISIHQTLFNPRLPFPTGGEALVRTIRATRRLTAHWRGVLPPDRFIEMRYEDLTGDPEPAIRRILQACGLAWDEACLHPERNPSAVRTPSRWQARQPIHRGAVERWRRYEPWLGPLAPLLDETDAG